ncbi:hypothetical protein BY458DRAFT_527133 [Sporodiniella umbellata]|nr:hypothetical protein BY458DRAFT_527133 [Sporodiniella umbellata]
MSYLTKDQLENYLKQLPETHKPSKDYQQVKNDLTYSEAEGVKERMNRLRLSTGTQMATTNIRTPSFPEKPKTSSPKTETPKTNFKETPKPSKPEADLPGTPKPSTKVSVPSALYIGQICPGCHEQVSGSVVSAVDKLWHTRCFQCTHCHKGMESEQYFEKDNGIYCAKDYRLLFSITCHTCQEPIEKQALKVLGKYYHENHFCCTVCKLPIGQEQFKVYQDEPYCQEDYRKKFGKKCSGCSQFLQGEYINALGQMWHKHCFHCTVCKQGFQGSFLVKDDRPYCEEHYPREQSPSHWTPKPFTPPSLKPDHPNPVLKPKPLTKPVGLKPPVPPKPALSLKPAKACHVCQEVIDGPCASALGHDYHIHHFQCYQCHRSLSSRVPGMWQGNSQGELICKMCM